MRIPTSLMLGAGAALVCAQGFAADTVSPPRDAARQEVPAAARPTESPVERNDASTGGPAMEASPSSSERRMNDADRPRHEDDLRRVTPNRGERRRPFHDDGRWESQPRLER